MRFFLYNIFGHTITNYRKHTTKWILNLVLPPSFACDIKAPTKGEVSSYGLPSIITCSLIIMITSNRYDTLTSIDMVNDSKEVEDQHYAFSTLNAI